MGSNGRWFAAPNNDSEKIKFAALLAFQGLRLDITVIASCKAVLASPVAFQMGICRSAPLFDDRKESVSSEGLLRQVLRGCPFEQDILTFLDRQSLLARCLTPGQPGQTVTKIAY